MKRIFDDRMIVIASHNPGKVREIAELLQSLDLKVRSAADFGLPEPVEDGLTFAENAAIKARAAARGTALPALADDSGLSVAALGGAPGIHSARWAGPGKDFALAMQRVQEEMGDNPDRRAEFVCALALASPEGHLKVFEGRVRGHLLWPPRGDMGFGYDPIFVPEGESRTFGEMLPEEKHAISHRARAFAKFKEYLQSLRS